MIDGSEKLNRQLAFELQNLRVFEKHSSAMTRVTSKRTAKKTIGWQKVVGKTTTLHIVHHTLLYIFLPSLHNYDLKMPNFTFCGEREHKNFEL